MESRIRFKNGSDKVFLYSEDSKHKVLAHCTRGVDVVYDSVGSTLSDSFEVTKTCGQVVFFWDGRRRS